VVNIAISGIGAAVFACYIVFDVQLMMGGGAYSIEPDEYVFAAINIYLVSLGQGFSFRKSFRAWLALVQYCPVHPDWVMIDAMQTAS
jgi:hypothetical protein